MLMTFAGRFPDFGAWFPDWLVGAFNPNDKTNLAWYRFLHFVVIVVVTVKFVHKDWPGLEWRIWKPVIKCGQQSLAVFCVGVFLSFAGHLILITGANLVVMQIAVSLAGFAAMAAVAYYIAWSKRQDLHAALRQQA